ncbi:magnesium chelatase family protein [Clostridium sp. DSM 8431]|uniref:YifB family Mg chelatase-like AAA ATPase n=1 Tax=Clostridium sp. DSM 8431 TaxID=1761781 RepID=UPI0008E192DA|nr:YifB family Mg chelatase-like AAA ATPase [Clostridium sp. DSM 8431]SFU36643.1 magnesium chelatase family protein [Clostridium sp. DSM 8431]
MAVKIYSATYVELQGKIIEVEVDILRGMPSFQIVGLPDASVKEAKERVRSAIINSGFEFPLGRITINLAPADVRKIGSLLDLPIALGILIETGQVRKNEIENYICFGELSLMGYIKEVRGTLPIIIDGIENNFKSFIFPYKNINEAKYIEEGLYYPFESLKEVVSFINYNDILPYDDFEELKENEEEQSNFDNIIGQEYAKRALMIAAAGKHNIILYGSTGVGKTMLAESLPSIMPKLSKLEEIEIAKIYSISGLFEEGKKISMPFRKPHHTASVCSIAGGGRNLRAGEVTLAHKGVLFLDELLEFKKEVIEVLREPLENKYIHINRLHNNVVLPSDFLMVGAFNLCPCGMKSLDFKGYDKCTCSDVQVSRYLNKMSKAVKDRIDIYAYVPSIEYKNIKNKKDNYTSIKMKEKVEKVRQIQNERFKGTNYNYNSDIKGKDIYELCRVGKKCRELLKNYFETSAPSMRAYGKVIKLARTISDLESQKDISEGSIIEALSYRKDYNGEII